MKDPATESVNDPSSLTAGASEPSRAPSRPWRLTAAVSALFCLGVCLVLILHHFALRAEDPLKSERLSLLKKQLLASPSDTALQSRIRELDLQLRERYFRFLRRTETGGWLLVGGLAVLFLALKRDERARQTFPLPKPDPDADARWGREASAARWSVATIGLIVVVAFLSLAFGFRSRLPESLAALQNASPDSSNLEAGPGVERFSLEEYQANWPRFRGPGGNGVSVLTNYPLAWNVLTGQGLLWKTPVAAPGFGSPVVWSNRVFLSGGDRVSRRVVCYHAATGALLWEQTVPASSPAPPRSATTGSGETPGIPEDTGYAASTVATDGRRVYAVFATGDLAAFTVEGQMAWSKGLGPLKNPYGHASSLLAWEGQLLLQLDQGQSDSGPSKLFAFDGATGHILWQRPRPVPASWATPIVIETGGQTQIVTLGDPFVIAYAFRDGTEIWRAELLRGEVTPSPIFAGGKLFVVSPSDRLLAIRPDGRGDVTKTHLAWSARDNVPDITSPVSNGELVFTLDSYGLLTCYEAGQGQKLWEHDLDMECRASPSLAGDRLYVVGKNGTVVVARAARQFEELARSDCGEPVSASPAFVRQHIFIRGRTNLFCFGQVEERLAKQF
jgi:outer membrane protein assembly factor BamB